MNNRVKEIREYLGLSQDSFANKLGMNSRGHISSIESGARTLTDRTIKQMCDEFNVNETWLRTGEGDMFLPPPEDIFEEMEREYGLDKVEKEIINFYLSLPPETRAKVKDKLRDFAELIVELYPRDDQK